MKGRLPFLLLAGLAAALVLVIAVELLPSRDPAPPAATVSEPTVRSVPRAADTADNGEAKASTLLSRPLFDPSRRAEKATELSEGGTGSVPSALPRLSGIMVSGDKKRAIFQSDGDEKPMVVGEGEQLAGWLVQGIEPGAVTVAGPDGIETIKPTFDPNAKPVQPVPSPQALAQTPATADILPGLPFTPGRFLPPNRMHATAAPRQDSRIHPRLPMSNSQPPPERDH